MLTERQKKLISDYAPRFYERSRNIQNEFLHLSDCAVSVLTDEEWSVCAEAICKVVTELQRVENIAVDRMKEAGLPVR